MRQTDGGLLAPLRGRGGGVGSSLRVTPGVPTCCPAPQFSKWQRTRPRHWPPRASTAWSKMIVIERPLRPPWPPASSRIRRRRPFPAQRLRRSAPCSSPSPPNPSACCRSSSTGSAAGSAARRRVRHRPGLADRPRADDGTPCTRPARGHSGSGACCAGSAGRQGALVPPSWRCIQSIGVPEMAAEAIRQTGDARRARGLLARLRAAWWGE